MQQTGKLINTALGMIILLVLCACGGLGGLADGPRDGLRFLSTNPSQTMTGSTVRILLEAFPSDSFEVNSDVTVSAVADNGATVTPGNTPIHFASGLGQSVLVPLDVSVPAGTTPGTTITITASRSSVGTGAIRNVTYQLRATTAAPSIGTSFQPTAVSAAAGGNAVSTVTIVPQAGFTGTLYLVGLIPDVICVPNAITFASGDTSKTATVTYRLPASSPTGTVTTVPVRVYNSSTTSTASYQVTTSAPVSGDFSISVAPASIRISGGNVSSPANVTITPSGGFTGPVTISFSLPGQGSLVLSQGHTNPFTLNVSDANPVQVSVPLTYVPGVGSAPIGTATVTATAGTHTHSATFTVTAS